MQFNISELESPLTQINEFLLKNKNFKAIKYLNKFLDENPSNNDAWLLLGIAKRRVGNLSDAIVCFKRAIEFNHSSLEAWGLLTITYLDKGDHILAEKTMQKAKELNPDDERIQFYQENLIRIYKKFGPFF
ncbi:MAG: tetratricopeptide repeat protein [Candidatus Heimdallarchaeota archaeon]